MIAAPVQAFIADLTCEQSTSIKVTNVTCAEPAAPICNLRWVFGVSSVDCDTGSGTGFVDSGPASNTSAPDTQQFGLVARAFCGKTKSDETARLVIITGKLDEALNRGNGTKQFKTATALICKPNYAIQRKYYWHINPLFDRRLSTLLINSLPSIRKEHLYSLWYIKY
jgi:hypothetical protein